MKHDDTCSSLRENHEWAQMTLIREIAQHKLCSRIHFGSNFSSSSSLRLHVFFYLNLHLTCYEDET